jgi:hypothetical protein
MLTGTPLDLTPFGPVLQGIGFFILLLALGALYLAIRKPKTLAGKVICSAIVVAVFGYLPATSMWEGHKQRERFDEAFARFQEHCRTAGFKIKRAVEDVDGIVWLKWRPKERNQYDQYRLNDPYGHDCDGEACIEQLLRATEGLENDPARKQPHYKGYKFVESVDPRDGRAYRYTLALPPQDTQLSSLPRPQLKRVRIDKPAARYGVTWDDLSTRDDRDRWIAGSSLQVIDLRTNEVIGERIGYMFDAGLGDRGGGRQPWTYARGNACPEFTPLGDGTARRTRTYRETPDFLMTVLKPREGE